MIKHLICSRLAALVVAGFFLAVGGNGTAFADSSNRSYFVDDLFENSDFAAIYAAMDNSFPEEAISFRDKIHREYPWYKQV